MLYCFHSTVGHIVLFFTFSFSFFFFYSYKSSILLFSFYCWTYCSIIYFSVEYKQKFIIVHNSFLDFISWKMLTDPLTILGSFFIEKKNLIF